MTVPPPSQSDSTSTRYEVPLRFSVSHGIARPGFQSHRKGEFWFNGAHISTSPFHLVDAEVLGVAFKQLSLTHRSGDAYLLSLELVNACTMGEAEDFIRRLVDAFTVSMAVHQQDPWYGNLLLEAGWAGLRDAALKPPGTISFEASVGMTSEECISINEAVVTSLHWSPLTTIFAEGMRAAQPKSKFLFWFVILEELESRDEFKGLFTPLFTSEEKVELLAASLAPSAKQRLKQLLNNPVATQEGRAQKLLRILQQIGLGQVSSLGKTIPLDEGLCQSLIKQRNNIAHKGATINVDQLYTVLFR